MNHVADFDASRDLATAVEQAFRTKTALNIVAGGTKSFLGNPADPDWQRLDLTRHSGVLQYEPAELILRARAGTRLTEIEELLADHGQMLAFEPPHFGPAATIGGCVATGLSGPRRASVGAVRDFVLGITVINGKGEILSFGGQVMKNVAGYDVSRLMVGSMGTLAVILDVSFKVLPLPRYEKTCVIAYSGEEAVERMCALAGSTHPVSATCYDGKQLYIRLSSTEQAVEKSLAELKGEQLEDQNLFWQELREQRNLFFEPGTNLWRLSVPAATPYHLTTAALLEWGGAQRWIKCEPQVDPRNQLQQVAGHATLFRSRVSSVATETKDQQSIAEVFQPVSMQLMQIHQRLKQSFDPHGLFNKGRMFRDL